MLIATRSIPLSQDTRTAWSSANVKLVKRDFDIPELQAYIQKHNVEALINLCNLDYDYNNLNIPVFNAPASIRFVSHPAALRRNMNAFIPPLNMNGPHWHKNGGFGGKGKAFHAEEFIPNFERTVLGWDIIVGDKPYTIEINTSPGVNELTAARIVRAIRGLI